MIPGLKQSRGSIPHAYTRYHVLTLDNINLHHPAEYERRGFPWAECDLLRRQAPIFYYERDDIEPFWAITRHADIMTVSDHPKVFINSGPRLRMALKGKPEIARAGLDTFGQERNWDPNEPPDMVFMDNPRHRHMRKHSSWAFTQGAMRRMQSRFDELAGEFTEQFIRALKASSANNEPVDFVSNLACKLPLAAIGEIMGLAKNDWRQILIWSNALVGQVAPEHLRDGESRGAAGYRNMYEFRTYLEALIQESRELGANRGGFIDQMVHRKVQGKLLTDQQLIGYLFLLIAAGNDTTRNAFTAGVNAFIDNPQQTLLLQENPDLIDNAVEEILRWSSPVGHFLRTTAEDFELSGTQIKAGDTVALFYPSANRDEAVFREPYSFDINRKPNDHLAFGFGAHFCLGTNLARAELKASLRAILPYIPHLKCSGEPQYYPEPHVVGFSSFQVRYED